MSSFPEPQFDAVLAWRLVGERHLRLELGQGHRRLNAIEFGGWTGQPPGARVRRLPPGAGRLPGGEAVQLVVVHRD